MITSTDFIIKLESEIIALSSYAQERLAVAVANQQIHFINTVDASSEKSFACASLKNSKNKLTFSHDAHYLAYAQENFIHLVDLQEHILVHRIEVDAGNVEILCFNSDGSYLIVGTDTGRVLLWHREHHEMLSRLTSFPEHISSMIAPLQNYVSSIASYNHLIASSGYGNSVVVINYITGVIITRIYPGRSRINAMVFLDENRLLIANEEGRVVKLFLNENHPHHQISASVGAIKHLLVLSDNTFALAASSHKTISLINIETMKVIDSSYITLKDNIVDMVIGSDMLLYIAVESGEIFSSKLMPVALLKRRIENRQFELAYQLVEELPILKNSSWFDDLEKIFSQYYTEAIKSLLMGSENNARQELWAFTKVASKKKIIQELFYAFDHYERLQYLVKNARLAPVYGLVDEFKPLKMTPEFQSIEKKWESNFEMAQKLIIKNREDEARELLKPFSVISSKAVLINLLFKVSTDIIDFSKAIGSRDYKALHVITKKYPALKMMPSYINALEETGVLVEDIMNSLKEDRFEDAKAGCELLLEVPHLQKHYRHISHFIHKAQQLFNVESSRDFRQCYEILDSFTELSVLPRSKILEEKWQKMIKKCEISALKGDAKDILSRIKVLMPLASRQEKIGSLLRLAYMIQLRALNEKDKRFMDGINQYLNFFGGDSEIKELLKDRDISMDIQWLQRDHWLKFYNYLPSFIYE
jgi:hypothetical protein